jgi:hypothetical protein
MERYGVFKTLPKGGYLWVCPANDLTEAKTQMLDLACTTGQEHFVYDFVLGQSVATSLEDTKAARSAAR